MKYGDFGTLDENQKLKMKRKAVRGIVLYVVIAMIGVVFLAIKISFTIGLAFLSIFCYYGVYKEYSHRNLWEKSFRQYFPGQEYGKYIFWAIPFKTGVEELDFFFFVKRGWFIGISVIVAATMLFMMCYLCMIKTPK